MKNLKKIVSVIVLAIFVFNSSNVSAKSSLKDLTNDNLRIVDNYDKKPKISLTLTFGRASKNCKGFGVCKMKITVELQKNASYEATNSDGNFELLISKDGVKEIINYFGTEAIILEEDFVLSDEITTKLELESGYTLEKGQYKIINRGGVYSIIF